MTSPTDSAPRAPLRIWFVRHGRTTFNDLGLAQGWCDSPLTVDGRLGVERLAGELADIEWAGVYSSPSERAMDTAEIIVGEAMQPIARDRRWKEYNFGIYEARPSDETFLALLALSDGDVEGDPHSRLDALFRGSYPALEGGETGHEFVSRVSEALGDVRARHRSGDILVVTHGMTIAVAATIFDPAFQMRAGIDNATFTLVEIVDGVSRIVAHGADSPRGLVACDRR
jgi:probable phosphoglycerate mutase